MTEPLITKYRPFQFDMLYGHEEVMRVLQEALSEDTRPHAFLLTGSSGIGKTTTSRIIASSLGADVTPVNAAESSGVDAIREVVESARYLPLTGAARRMVIIDEAHRLSRNAFDALLMVLEEPPPHLFLALCSTELPKIPDTIVTRCYHIRLKPLSQSQVETLVCDVIAAEGWNVPADVIQAVVQSSEGSARLALNLLQATHTAQSRDEARAIINYMGDSEPLADLVKLLLSGNRSWVRAQELLVKADITDYEEGIGSLTRYIATAMLRAESEEAAIRAYDILENIVYPVRSYDAKAVFMAAIGRTLWSK